MDEFDTTGTPRHASAPLPYQQQLLDLLRSREPDAWAWFASNPVRRDSADAVRLDLLRSSYRLDANSAADLYAAARDVADALGLDAPLTLYQAQGSGDPNVSLAFVPGEIHIILHGGAKDLLDADEWRSVFGHELAHFELLTGHDGQYGILAEILAAMGHAPQPDAAALASDRLNALYTEIYCDRVSLDVTGRLEPTISSLVKLHTSLANVSVSAYLQQAQEILSAGQTRTEGLDHPETYIRAAALQMHAAGAPDADERIAELIEGDPALAELDLLGEHRLLPLTRRAIDCMLSEPWMRTDAHLAHARLFFDDYAPPDAPADDRPAKLPTDLPTAGEKMTDYWAAVLLDFVAIDSERMEPALALAAGLCAPTPLTDRFADMATRELKITRKVFDRVAADREALLATARREFADDAEGTA